MVWRDCEIAQIFPAMLPLQLRNSKLAPGNWIWGSCAAIRIDTDRYDM